jgi:hydroxymethylpyrimidine/phosphomethylpyrimidine kinase
MSDPGRIPAVMSIAGSDSGGGAGIQADLKAFARCGVHGTTAITALTAQNTVGVDSIHPVPPDMVVAQIRAVAEDIGIDAVKTGMLGDAVTITVVVEALDIAGDAPIVVDPVLVAESGAVLLEPPARSALIERLLPRATVATPNVLEARELTGLGEGASQEELARAVQALGPRAAIVTGGHTEEARTSSSNRAARRSGSRARGIRRAPRTARVAPTRQPWRRCSPVARASRPRRARRSGSRRTRSVRGCAASAPALVR